MDDGGAVILSVAKYYSPEGKAIQDTGVVPATVVAETEAQVDLDDNGEPLPQAEQVQQKKPTEEDPVVKKAVEVLK
jgi:carboxyl-terminal processing protease